MKRILMSIVLLNLCGHISYGMNNEQLHEPSKWTRSQVERALKAFEIPTESVQIYGFNRAGQLAGYSVNAQAIAINEYYGENAGQIYTSFHEAAHIKDFAGGPDKHAAWLTRGFLVGYTSMYLSMFTKLVSFAKKAIITKPKFASPILTALFSGAAGAAAYAGPLSDLFYDNIALQWATEQSEYRADKMAVEKLIILNEIEPVVYKLMCKKIREEEYGNQRIYGHPPARSEYKAIKKTLEKNGYEVRKFRPEDAPNDLVIEVTKNGEGALARIEHFYSKV